MSFVQVLLFFLLSIILHHLPQLTTSLPLSTSSRWIVDESGRRVKLACVNWVSHLEPMVAEGLGKRPLDAISKGVASMGFNCVRLTWPLFLVTDDSLRNVTVRRSFEDLGLAESIGGIKANNPDMLNRTLIEAYKAVVQNLADNRIMVILDNHISKPGWCCSDSDGSGFFGDDYFDPDEWIEGLTRMATMFNGSSNVVGMSLRNELRGPKQNVDDWYRYMQRGAEAVHAMNPNVLVILSGLNYDTDLSFLSNKQVELTFTGKHVFELHWYAFTDGQAWADGDAVQVCGWIKEDVIRKAGFVADQGWPLFLSEFGLDQSGVNDANDNRYLGCILSVLAELDLDWALWAVQGSYYLRQGVRDFDETYGVLTRDWSKPRNSPLLKRIASLRSPFRGPGFFDVPPYEVVYHPSIGLCIARKSLLEPLRLGPCNQSEGLAYTGQRILSLKGTLMCLKDGGEGEQAKLRIICNDSISKWDLIPASKMHGPTMLLAIVLAVCAWMLALLVALSLSPHASAWAKIKLNCDPEI